MPRWHEADCRDPDVFVEGDYPQCRACGSAASLDWIRAQTTASNPGSSIPPDEPAGSLNLSWPPQVPWSNDSRGDDGPDEEAGPKAVVKVNGSNPEESSQHETESDVQVDASYAQTYGRRLEPDEIRLICFSSDDKDEGMVHIDLEAYKQDACPEYEAVSYAWGGEDGDNRLCEPVYVGPHWDVLLQTRNCVALLRYLRPLRGLRMIWVDALCINQYDVVERGAQVAKMDDIYQRCSKVVVWPGADIVTPTPKRFRRRIPLHEIQKHVTESGYLGKLFSRRYFSRVWVIQELVLAPFSVIPILDMDCIAGDWAPDKLAGMLMPDTWESLGRQWLGRINSVVSFPGKTMDQVLRHTWSSSMQATDPRDKIFGVLGLHQPQHEELDRLVPDYSLSFQSIIIGISAYMLFIQGTYEVLYNGAGLNAQAPLPSWVPDWKKGWTPDDWSDRLYYPRCKPFHNEPRFECKHEISLDASPVPLLVLLFPLLDDKEHLFDYLSHFAPGVKETWRFNASVDTNTGALSLKLFHIKSFRSPPGLASVHDVYDDFKAYWFYEDGYALEFRTPSADLQKMKAGPNHLFVLLLEDLSLCLLFFLEETGTKDCFRLIRCCPCYELRLSCKTPGRDWDVIESLGAEAWRNLYVALEGFYSYWNTDSMVAILRTFIDGHELLGIFAEVFESILVLEESGHDTFEMQRAAARQKLFEGFKNSFRCMKIDEDVIVFRASPDEWNSLQEYPSFPRNISNDLWSKRLPSCKWSECVGGPWKHWHDRTPNSGFIYVQYSLEDLAEDSLLSPIWSFFGWLTRYRRVTGETEREMVLRGPKPEDRFVYAPIGSQDSAAKLDLDGYFQEVKII